MAALTFTGSQHRLLLPEDVKDRVAPWIQTQATTTYRSADQAPFRRMVDFWFTAIAWAVAYGIEPAQVTTGRLFVNLGPNPNDIRNFDEWRAELLTILAVRDFGVDSPGIQDTRKIIDLANRYAEAGAPLLLDALEERADLALPKLYVVADMLAQLVRDAISTRGDRSF
jgi:hypothetical protein